MPENGIGIDTSAFQARVAERKKKKAEEINADLESMVGYSTTNDTQVTSAQQSPPVLTPAPRTNGHTPSRNNSSPRPPRISQIPGLNGLTTPAPPVGLASRMRSDADEMFEGFHGEKSELDKVVDAAIDGLDVVTAYRKWIRKMNPKMYDGQTESIMISCPVPGHEDKNPSAWINTSKGEGGLWHCGGCAIGGDKYDLAAIGLGYNFQSYKTDGSFRDLKLQMARELGIDVDSYLLGPAAKAYLASKETTQFSETEHPRVPDETLQPKKQTQPKKRVSNEEALLAMHAAADKDYRERMHKYYPSKSEPEQESKVPPPSLPSVPLVTPTGLIPNPSTSQEGIKEVQGLASNMPKPAVGTKGPLPTFTGFAPSVPSSTPAPKSAEPQQTTATPQPTTVPPIGLPGLAMPLPNGQIFVSQPAPEVDTNDPGFIKAMLADQGVEAEPTDPDEDDFEFATLNFKLLVPEDTFLGSYCSILLDSDTPDEWNFWNAMAGLGVAVGKRIGMVDRIRVFSNLYICLLGSTSSGKSIAKNYIIRLLRDTLPWVAGDPGNTAPRIIRGASSGEILVSRFRDEIRDPAKPSQILDVKRVTGLIEYDEFQTVMAKASSLGSNFVPILQGLFDGYDDVESHSFTTGDKTAPDPFASMLTSTQPKNIQRLVGDEHVDNGFLNRILFVTGKPKPPIVLGGNFMDVSPSGPYLRSIHNWAVENEGHDIGWTDQSQRATIEFLSDQVIPDMDSQKDNYLIQRVNLIVKKLIMLFTLNLKNDRVPMEAVNSAIAVYPYLMESYSILDKAISFTASADMRLKVMKQVARLTVRENKPPTKRQIHDAIGRNKIDGEQLLRTLKTLCELGDLKEIQWPLPGMGQVGRKTVRYGLASND